MKHTKFLFLVIIVVLWPVNTFATRLYSREIHSAGIDQQVDHVTGKVTDKEGEPVIGAGILVKGTSRGAVTDIDGYYTVEASAGDILEVSCVGYVTQMVKVGDSSEQNIQLIEDTQYLDEVVVVGYGQVRKSDITGSISSVKIDHNKAVFSNGVDKLLQGNAPGVYVNSGSSEPGGVINVRIRGTSTLNGNKEPLYVVDGVIMNDATEDVKNSVNGGTNSDPIQTVQSGLSGVNPQDIQSIEILKDASATAIYGSRASNGVILITTKEGRNNKPQINASVGFDWGKASRYIDVLNADEYLAYRREKDPNSFDADFTTPTRDWQRELFGTASTQSYRVSINGGDDKMNYYVAGGYLKNNGQIQNTGLNQADMRTNFKYNLSSRLTFKGTFNIVRRVNDMTTGTDGLGSQYSSITRSAVLYRPFTASDQDVDDDSELRFSPDSWITDYVDHAIENRTIVSAAFDYKIIKGLTFHVMASYDTRNKERSRWYGNGTYTGYKMNGKLGISDMKSQKESIEALLYYDYTIAKVHHLQGVAGFTYEKADNTQNSMLGEIFSFQELGIHGISYADRIYPNSHYYTNESTASELVRLNYSYADRYLLTFTSRIDGSSKFQKANRYSYFPSLALAWRVNQEKFLSEAEWLSNLKLRAGWGLTGNQSIAAYATQNTYGSAEYSTGSGSTLVGVAPSAIANPDLKWETTSQINVGIDAGFFDNRLAFTLDAYHKKTSDILQSMSAPASTGFSSLYVNCGDIQNNGVEFSFNAVPVSTRNFSWTIGANISHNKNKILDLGLPEAVFGTETYEAYYGTNLSYNTDAAYPVNIFIKGKPLGLFWGYKTNGIFQSDEEAGGLVYNGTKLQAGDIAYVDTDNDGVITTADRVIIGDPNPDFTFGFNTALYYKDFTLSAQFHGSYGNDIINANKLDNTSTYQQNNVLREAWTEAWRPDVPSTTYPRLGVPLREVTDRFVEDASFLRLGSLTLSWNVPVNRNKAINGLQIGLTGKNLFTITNYSGYNPDTNSFTNDSKRIGIDYGSFPITRSFSVNFNIVF